jgi:hypothetical protein
VLDHPTFQKCVVFGNAGTDEDPNAIVKLEGLARLEELVIHTVLTGALCASGGSGVDAAAGGQGADDVSDDRGDAHASSSTDALNRLLTLHELCNDPCIAAISRQLLGPEAQLMKDKYIFKQAGGGGGFPPHQDMTFLYNRVCTDAVNFGIAFNDADEENGSLEVAPGLQRVLHHKHVLGTTETKMPDSVVDGVCFEHTRTRAGDVILFSAWLLHRSTVNTSSRDRAVYYVTYGLPGRLEGSSGSLYRDYYDAHYAWVLAGYPSHHDADRLLGDEKPRPTLIPASAFCGGVVPSE